ncbi:hypothetical protein DL95DRAFT_409905 [Leptodontidium sp. 2 PMI_412]|nr:hypothetical protein DL95DRAFT_409905 [Leptodontidium sp. 2 PMI_412]
MDTKTLSQAHPKKKKKKTRRVSSPTDTKDPPTGSKPTLQSFPALPPSPIKTKVPWNGTYEVTSALPQCQDECRTLLKSNIISYQTYSSPCPTYERPRKRKPWVSYIVLATGIVVLMVCLSMLFL